MKKLLGIFALLVFLSFTPAFGETFAGSCKKNTVRNLDINLMRVDVLITVDSNIDRIHWVGTVNGHKPSIIEHRETLRFKTVYRGEGSIQIKVPNTIVLESCIIRLLQGNLTMEKTSVGFILISSNQGSLILKDSRIRNGMINTLIGNIAADIELKRNLSLNLNSTQGTIQFRQNKGNQYHLEYVHNLSTVLFLGKPLTKSRGWFGSTTSKRRVLLTIMQSDININIIE